uniref:EOG090X0J7Y n=1 Tax=Alona affinis TaxID=381656 RepID=A0A9N6WU68_9CRUS|nr:EOG090X0J7Y [Alona affinis]
MQTNKPLMEKRRRARINHSLAVLKSLIIKDEQSEASTSQSRLEKADILELTVLHIRSLEKQKASDTEPDQHLKSYQLGYQSCCQDIERFLNDTTAGSGSKERLMQHLALQQEKISGSLPAGSDVSVKPTRLPDGRLALIFSPPSSWLISSAADSSSADAAAPATPPSSPAQQQVGGGGGVWRPWF